MGDDELYGKFTWVVKDWSKIRTTKYYSEVFTIGGYNWRLLCFPKGNTCDFLSVYLDVADSATQSYGWTRHAHFSLSIVSQVEASNTIKKDTSHTFEARESDWGFTQFLSLSELHDQSSGFLVNDSVVLECEVHVRKDQGSYSYDSRKETGFIGLKNQGATCYMNSLLQTLFHIPYFRKAVYHMPTTETDLPHKSIPLALQALFYKVQFSDQSVATKDLTRSFGWDAYDSFMQHDVQELNRVLCEKLEEKMKSTSVEGTIQKLFEGHMVNYIDCINVNFKSTRKEAFLDLQLDVKGCKDIYESFDKYVEVERLEGDNKYRAEGHGLQDAKKGVLFMDFPPVLQLQLKRFEYDFVRDTMVKINDRYEFPAVLDLDVGNGKYLSPDADRTVRNKYLLHSVLVHSGGVSGGHYYAFIRPDLATQWYKFDDERVTKEEPTRAIDDQYGGDEDQRTNTVTNVFGNNISPATLPLPAHNTPGNGLKLPRHSNAYMLVYIREADRDKIVCQATEEDIAEHLRVRLQREQDEKDRKRKEKAEAHLYTIIKLVRDEDMRKQIGSEIFFDLVDHDKAAHQFRVPKQTPFAEFKEQVEKELGVPVHRQRYWLWAKRQNQTFRPNRMVTFNEEGHTVSQLRDSTIPSKSIQAMSDLKLYLEVVEAPAASPEPKTEILLFFKVFDPVLETLAYAGRMFLPAMSKMMDHHDALCKMAGLPLQTELSLFEEIKFEPTVYCEAIDWHVQLKAGLQLGDGDIVCVQRRMHTGLPEWSQCRFTSLPEFLEHIRNRQRVIFRELNAANKDSGHGVAGDNGSEGGLVLDLAKSMGYDEVTQRLAEALGIAEPTTLRLTAHNCYTQAPKLPSLRFRGVGTLADMLTHYNQMTDILYYEVLDMPLPDLEGLKTLKVAFHGQDTQEVSTFNVRLPCEACIADVLADMRTKLQGRLSRPEAGLRLLEIFYSKIYKVFPLADRIDSIDDQYWTLRVEEIPEDEAGELPDGHKLIHVYHYARDVSNNNVVHNFGDPFLLRIGPDEPLSSIKARVQKRLGTPDDEFSSWRFAFHSHGRPEYLADNDLVANRFVRRDTYGAWEHYLGVEHEDKHPKRQQQNQSGRAGFEKPVKIYN